MSTAFLFTPSNPGVRMPYTVRAAQNGEVTEEEDYIEPDGVHGEAAVSATMCMHVQPSALQL